LFYVVATDTLHLAEFLLEEEVALNNYEKVQMAIRRGVRNF